MDKRELPSIYKALAKRTRFEIKLSKEFMDYSRGKVEEYTDWVRLAHPKIPFMYNELSFFYMDGEKGFNIGGGYPLKIESKKEGEYPELTSDLSYSLRNVKRIVTQGQKILRLVDVLEEERKKSKCFSRTAENTASQEILDYQWMVNARNEFDISNLEKFLNIIKRI